MIRSPFPQRIVYRRFATLALLLVVPLAGFARAEAPVAPVRCILLRNGNVLEGTPVQEGDSITIAIGENQSLRLPANQVLCWAEDRFQLYRYRRDHRSKPDLLTHLEEARWCIRENLFEPASAELDAARAIDAAHPGVARVQTMLRAVRKQALEKADARESEVETQRRPEPESEATSKSTSERPPESEAMTKRNEEELEERSARTLARLSRSTIADYASRVQPILINRCGQAGCHGSQTAHHPDWRLTLPLSRHHRRLPADMTRGNLRDLVRWIDLNEPRLSPLLRKATESHAEMQGSPLGPADDDVLAELENWIASVAGELSEDNPRTEHRIAAVPPNVGDIPHGPRRPTGRGGEPRPGTNQIDAAEPPRPKRLPPVTNPFDPQVFNRLHHRGATAVGR